MQIIETIAAIQKFLDANATLIASIVGLITAITVHINGRNATQKAKVQGVVREVEARKLPAIELGSEEAHALAVQLAPERGVKLKPAALDAEIVREVKVINRESVAPPSQ